LARSRRESDSASLTLGQALAATVRLIVWCKSCRRQSGPDVAREVARHDEALTIIGWAGRLHCSTSDARDADFVVSGAAR
jgi:hypothetical protein